MDYKKKYEQALEKAKRCLKDGTITNTAVSYIWEIFPELKESKEEKNPNGGIVLEDFNEGEGFYKVNLAYLNKEQVIEIEELVKKWNPELKESKEEGIRKSIIELVKQSSDILNPMNQKSMIEWLKKQGELVKEYEDKLDRISCESFDKGYKAAIEKQGEKKPAWSEEDEKTLSTVIEKGDLKPSEIQWLKCLKERVRPQSKQEWSEEDENGFGDSLWAIQQARTIAKDENEMGNLWYAENWLKSLKDRMKGE